MFSLCASIPVLVHPIILFVSAAAARNFIQEILLLCGFYHKLEEWEKGNPYMWRIWALFCAIVRGFIFILCSRVYGAKPTYM